MLSVRMGVQQALDGGRSEVEGEGVDVGEQGSGPAAEDGADAWRRS